MTKKPDRITRGGSYARGKDGRRERREFTAPAPDREPEPAPAPAPQEPVASVAPASENSSPKASERRVSEKEK